jgi:hypothetical protein
MDVYNDSKYFPTLLEIGSLRAPNRNYRDVSWFNVEFKRRNCLSIRSDLAANAIDSAADIFNRCSVWVNMIN